MKIPREQLKITPSPRENRGGQSCGSTDPSVNVELQGAISITCGVHFDRTRAFRFLNQK